jgi:hypothetical protein
MSRPLQDASLDDLKKYLAEARDDENRLRTLLHELSYRVDPAFGLLKERAEQTRLSQVIAHATTVKTSTAKATAAHGPDSQAPADAAEPQSTPLANTMAPPVANTAAKTRPGRRRPDTGRHDDFPGFNPGPLLDGLNLGRRRVAGQINAKANRKADAEDRWHSPQRHMAVLAMSILGLVGLTVAQLNGVFRVQADERGVSDADSRAIDIPQLRVVPVGSNPDAIDMSTPANGVSPVSATAPLSPVPSPRPPVSKLKLTTEIANMYSGEGPAIARAAIAAAGLGVGETVRWKNDRTGRYGSVTLITQNPHRKNCYTARITRLDTKTPQRRTQQLCF